MKEVEPEVQVIDDAAKQLGLLTEEEFNDENKRQETKLDYHGFDSEEQQNTSQNQLTDLKDLKNDSPEDSKNSILKIAKRSVVKRILAATEVSPLPENTGQTKGGFLSQNSMQ